MGKGKIHLRSGLYQPDAPDLARGIEQYQDFCRTAATSETRRRVAIIINPRSHANKADPQHFDEVLAAHPQVLVARPADAADLLAILQDYAARHIDLLVISGGDGTVRDVLSALPLAYPGSFPDIAILASGNTNLAARVLGSPGSGATGLDKFLAAAQTRKLSGRVAKVLQVSWNGAPERPPLHGFMFGAAAFTEGKRIADASLHKRGIHHGLAVAFAIAGTCMRALFGHDTPLTAGIPMKIATSASIIPVSGPRFLVMATTLNRLIFGLWPFWGGKSGGISWTDIDARPKDLAFALAAVLLRRVPRRLAGQGYRSGASDVLNISMNESFMLDGEFFEPGIEGIHLSAPWSITVVTA
jgi:hypothetical protein